jgi:flagellar biosynthesis chaperone FliJ
MKKFHWPLQRLFDVTVQREKALRMEMMSLARQIAAIRGDILQRRTAMRLSLEELARMDIQQRIAGQEMFMKHTGRVEVVIRALELKQKDAQSLRAKKSAQLMKARSSRKTLQRLADEARQVYLREQSVVEQKQFDETAHTALARKALLTGAGKR